MRNVTTLALRGKTPRGRWAYTVLLGGQIGGYRIGAVWNGLTTGCSWSGAGSAAGS
jgi:hypothetical protein